MTTPSYYSFSSPVMYGDIVSFSETPEPTIVSPQSTSLVGRNVFGNDTVGDYLPGVFNTVTNTFTVEDGPLKLVKLDFSNNWGLDHGH